MSYPPKAPTLEKSTEARTKTPQKPESSCGLIAYHGPPPVEHHGEEYGSPGEVPMGVFLYREQNSASLQGPHIGPRQSGIF